MNPGGWLVGVARAGQRHSSRRDLRGKQVYGNWRGPGKITPGMNCPGCSTLLAACVFL